MTDQSSPRIGLRIKVENGAKNFQIRTQRDGPVRTVREEAKNGMNLGTKKLKNLARRKTKRVMTLVQMIQMAQILKSKTQKNGVKTKILPKNGMKNGENATEMTNVRNGVTNGKLTSTQAAKRVKIGDRHTPTNTLSWSIGQRSGTTNIMERMEESMREEESTGQTVVDQSEHTYI